MQLQVDVATRLARYTATLDARDLWPELNVSAFRAAQAEIARVTAAVLSGTSGPVRLELPADGGTRALGAAVSAAGMGPLLGFWCKAGWIEAWPPVLDLLTQHLEHGHRRAARLRQEFERILVPFANRGIEVLVLKGTDTAYRYFPEPGTRPTTDIDILVMPHDLQAAQRTLRDLGFAEARGGDRYRTTWIPPTVGVVRSLELAHADNPWSLDLHVSLDRSLFPGLTMTFGHPGPEAREGEVWRQFSRPVRVLPAPLLLNYLAAHTSSHFYSMTLIRLVELVLVARRDFGARADRWRAFRDVVRRSATGRFVFPALYLTERLAPGAIDALVLDEIVATASPRLLRLVHAMTPASAQRLHPYPFGERFIWATSLKEVLGSLAELAWPRQGDRPASPRQALGIQWRRIRKGFLRIVGTRIPL